MHLELDLYRSYSMEPALPFARLLHGVIVKGYQIHADRLRLYSPCILFSLFTIFEALYGSSTEKLFGHRFDGQDKRSTQGQRGRLLVPT